LVHVVAETTLPQVVAEVSLGVDDVLPVVIVAGGSTLDTGELFWERG
jgi:hypothetical protein